MSDICSKKHSGRRIRCYFLTGLVLLLCMFLTGCTKEKTGPEKVRDLELTVVAKENFAGRVITDY